MTHNPTISLAELNRVARALKPIVPLQHYWGPQECAYYLNRVDARSSEAEVAKTFDLLVEMALVTDVALLPVIRLFFERIVKGRPPVDAQEVLERCCGNWRERLAT